jgi:hypothetical protein
VDGRDGLVTKRRSQRASLATRAAHRAGPDNATPGPDVAGRFPVVMSESLQYACGFVRQVPPLTDGAGAHVVTRRESPLERVGRRS